jgi:hypothetical protein
VCGRECESHRSFDFGIGGLWQLWWPPYEIRLAPIAAVA